MQANAPIKEIKLSNFSFAKIAAETAINDIKDLEEFSNTFLLN
jgi:hypothetical protein